ncbi:Fe-S cluster assembly protein SufD [Micropruina sonneratiae]|uniref:Fe-S cluster assembly protein SufD n=1 Tax=Micropruina sonneratiae TaxID=2986940 RepID=UPI0022269E02|nr:Fe-S cluster assembly protein SufD [Micropruina sp. KQZ13P-5]MCW3157199.1 Fe-S cluster assembly protein SufD [Micropruina sp. KQZ13P-5]
MAAPVLEAVEALESHLHPTPSFEVDDHPYPKGQEEIWRFTPLRAIKSLLTDEPSDEHLDWDETLPQGASSRSISAAEARLMVAEAPIDRVSVLAAAHSGGAQLIEIEPGAELDGPLTITLTGSGQRVWGHLVFKVGAQATGTILLRHEGSASYATKVDVLVGDGAKVNFVSIQDWDDDALHGGHHSVLVGRDAQVRTVTVSLGGKVVRLAETARFAAPGGSLEQFGLYFVDAGQHIEHRLFVDHNAPHTHSNVDYRGALQGEGARSVWIGDVLIRKVAEGISTYESNKNLVLTDGCRADSVPNLEIETGEIEGAGHSSTTGRFDDEQLFYLRSRGISEAEARRLVVRGFFADIVRRIGVPEVEEHMMAAVERELAVTMGSYA